MAWWHDLLANITPSIRCRYGLRKAACIFAGMNHMQPLLLATTNSHYLLDRFCMERCCSGEYVSRIVTSIIFMEVVATLIVACIGVGIGIGKCSNQSGSNDATQLVGWTKPEEECKGFVSCGIQFIITLGYFQILFAFIYGGQKGHMEWFYVSLIFQYFVICIIAGGIGFWDVGSALWYLMAIPVGPVVVFSYQMIIHSWIRNHGPRNVEYIVVECQIVLAISISMMATIFWTAGYSISYAPATIDNLATLQNLDGTAIPNVTTGTAEVEVKYANSAQTITLTAKVPGSGTPVPITVTATVAGDSNNYDVTITATIDSGIKGRITVYQRTLNNVSASGNQKITLSESGTPVTTATVNSNETGTVTINKGAGVNNLSGVTDATYTYKTFYPNHGHYISKVVGTKGPAQDLWCTGWDGGECEYAEYYERKTGGGGNTKALAVVHVRILGGLDTRYFGTDNTTGNNWKIITSKADFIKYLDKLRGTTDLGLTADTPSADKNLVKGTKTSDYNTNFPKAITARKWEFDDLSTWNLTPIKYPVLMQGLSVGAVGSIFPNLIPKTLTCPRTTRTLTVVNMFLVPLPHVINLALADNGWPRWSPGNKWEGHWPHDWRYSWLLYIFYILAILFAIFNVHYPEWALSSFLRNNTWFVFLMILFTDVLNETFNAISRAGICSQKSAATKEPGQEKKLNHPCLHNKIACLMNLTYIPFWMTTTPMMKSYVSSLDPFLCDKDRDHWPTARYGRLRSFGYWCKCACRGLYNSPRKLVTLNMRKALTRKDPPLYFLVTHSLKFWDSLDDHHCSLHASHSVHHSIHPFILHIHSIVRVTHKPTGLSVKVQQERTNARNKQIALQKLAEKVELHYRVGSLPIKHIIQRILEERLDEIKGPDVDASWAKHIRSYVFNPEKRFKDHRTNYETTAVQDIMDGDLLPVILDYLEHVK